MKKPATYSLEANIAPIRAAAGADTDYRALVCVFLLGANDSHNMVPPVVGSPNRQWYDQERGTLAVTPGTELPLADGWGLHPSMPNTKALFDQGRVGIMLNVGNLKEPTRRANRRTVKRPDQLYSHNSQVQQWEGLPGYFTNLVINGWMGRAGELAGPFYNPNPFNDFGPCFSIQGRRTQMQGWEAGSNDLNTSGAQSIGSGDGRSVSGFDTARNAARVRQEHGNVYQRLMQQRIEKAIANQTAMAAQLQTLGATPAGRFSALTGSAKTLGDQLAVVSRIIQSRANFAHRRDLFYVALGGWDDHNNLVTNYGPRLAAVDQALFAFWQALNDLQVQNHVITFTQSEFGRALRQNGTGSDHGWGGHAIVMGGGVNGGRMFGQSPDLKPGSEDDDDQGRLIPTTSVEQYVGTFLKWWGIPEAQLPLVLENSTRFTPRTLDYMVKEPTPELGVSPTFQINLMNKVLPSFITRTTTREIGHSTIFDESGKLRCLAQNMLPNSAGVGGQLNVPNALPTGWANGDLGSGITVTMVGQGTTDDGEEYVDVRWQGTNNSGAPRYPHVNFVGNSNSLRPPLTPGVGFQFSMKLTKIAGSFAGTTSGQVVLGIQYLNSAGTYQTEASAGPRALTEADGATPKMLRVVGRSLNTAHALGNPQITVSVPNGNSVDFTLRIIKPSFTYGIHYNSNLIERPEYVRTTPNGATSGIGSNEGVPPRWDHNPVTKALRGLLHEGIGSTNVLQNAIFNSAVIGTPGTAPTGAALSNGQAGMNASIVDMGIEDGMPFLEFRVFGTPSATGEWSFVPFNTITAVVPGANEDWTASCFCRIVGGSMANVSAFTWEVMGRVAGAATQAQTVSLLTITDRSLVQQRFQASARMGATIDGVDARWRLSGTVGQPVDITFRVGGPQLEKVAFATSFKPTGPGFSLAQATETYSVLGANFTSWYNTVEGTFAVKAINGVGPATVIQQYPQAFSVSAGTANTDSYRIYMTGGQLSGVDGTGRGGSRADAAGVNQGDVTVSAAQALIPFETVGSRVARYKLNDSNYAQKGVVAVADTAFTMPTGLDRLNIGQSASVGFQRTWFQSLDYYNVGLDDAGITYLSANG